MNTTLDTLSAAAALVSSLGIHAAEAAPLPRDHGGVLQALRTAQIELFSDHDAAALTALREAQRGLISEMPAEAVAMVSIEEAAWHIRRHDMHEAQAAIGQARQQLA